MKPAAFADFSMLSDRDERNPSISAIEMPSVCEDADATAVIFKTSAAIRRIYFPLPSFEKRFHVWHALMRDMKFHTLFKFWIFIYSENRWLIRNSDDA
ncbi:MAG: hypothetical protein ABW179_04985 [Methylobacterium sp.]